MLVLTIDTSTGRTVVGLVSLGMPVNYDGMPGVSVVYDCVPASQENRHVEELAPLVAANLGQIGHAAADLEAVVVGVGPGPYTGLRIGVAAAAALGDALFVPVYGVCSLDAVAEEAFQAGVSGAPVENLLVVADAKRREVHWASYRGGERVSGLGVCRPSELRGQLEGFEPDAVAGRVELVADTEFGALPRVPHERPAPWGLAQLATLDALYGQPPEPLLPLYLRPPDAKPPKGVPA